MKQIRPRKERIFAWIAAVSLVALVGFCTWSVAISRQGSEALTKDPEEALQYETTLFDTTYVHRIEIFIDDWNRFLGEASEKKYHQITVCIDGKTLADVGLKTKGTSSLKGTSERNSERYSLKINFGHYQKGLTYDGLDTLNLNNMIYDNTMMKDYLSYRMMNNFGVHAPLTSFAEVVVNGRNLGLYIAVEGVDSSFLERTQDGAGNLYKPDGANNKKEKTDTADTQDASEKTSSSDQETEELGIDGTPATMLQYIDDELDSYSEIFDTAETKPTEEEKVKLVSSLKKLSSYSELETVLDTDQVLRYLVVHNFIVNTDSYTGRIIHNYYLYENDGKMAMIPWDYNTAFGSFELTSTCAAVNTPIDEVLNDRPMQAWIFSNPVYTARYHELYQEFLDTCHAEALIENTKELIASYVKKDPTKFCSYSEFIEGVDALEAFVTLRTESVEGQLLGIVPATNKEQAERAEELVNPGELDIAQTGMMD